MVLQEIEKQVKRWMESKSSELTEQQRALQAEYQDKVRAIQSEYQQKLEQVKAEYKTQQEKFFLDNRQCVEEARNARGQIQNAAREVDAAVLKGKQELGEISRRQSALQDACERSLQDQEQAIVRQNKKLDVLRDEIRQMDDSKGSGGVLPILLSLLTLVLVVALVVLLQMKVFPFGGSSERDREKGDAFSDIERTPKPTVEPTQEPTEVPETATPEPSPAPTPDPQEGIMSAFPFLSRGGFPPVEDRVEAEGLEFLQTYRIDWNLYAGVFYGDAEGDAFEQLCAKYNRFVIEAAPVSEPEPFEAEQDPAEETDMAPNVGMPWSMPTPAPATEDAPEQEGSPAGENTPEEDDRITTVLGCVRRDNYLCVFYVKDKDLRQSDYWKVIEGIKATLRVDGAELELQTFLSVLAGDEVITKCAEGQRCYPIQAGLASSLLPEAEQYEKLVKDGDCKAVWMYAPNIGKLFLYVYDAGANAEAFNKKVQAARKIGKDTVIYVGAKDGVNCAFIFPNAPGKEKEKWYTSEPWFNDLKTAYKLK